ncbi:unnamed protein product [Notodromas monacha]|uniref:Guanine deaminase n=1 Tax=Notodromas monacha TaxID=399045 RepID=A0A7R9BZH8_9CRUS|nr:unnamed protein product [Notodromas monacha]CAG0923194.1 unnamed protein product [Notodromas monacha]
MPSDELKVFSGLVATPRVDRSLDLGKKVFGVDATGKIVFFEDVSFLSELRALETPYEYEPACHSKAERNELWIPGLIDTHTHAPQYPNLGLGLDLPLLPWLEKYTFPLEAKFADSAFAAEVYPVVVGQLLRSGTTTAAYHATIHQEATRTLFSTCQRMGQRAVVGKVSMTRNGALGYQETPEESFRCAEEFVNWAMDQAKSNDLVLPSVTPRFAVTSYADCLLKLGEIANRYKCHVQTHISENKKEVEVVKEAFKSKNYTEVGLCDVKRLLQAGVKVGLGTDMSGGFSHSMFDAMRQAVEASKILCVLQSDPHPLSTEDAFFLATMGSAQVLKMEDKIGSLAVGRQFDACLMTSFSKISEHLEADLDMFNHIFYTADDRNVKKVFVDGKLVVGH